MTDDPSKSGDGSPADGEPAQEPAREGSQTSVRAFGRRPAFAGAATVLSHNFRAPIVPGADAAEPPAETPARDPTEESDPPVAEPVVEADNGPPPPQADPEAVPPEQDPLPSAPTEPAGDAADVMPAGGGEAPYHSDGGETPHAEELSDGGLDDPDDEDEEAGEANEANEVNEADVEPIAGSLLELMAQGEADPEDENGDGLAPDDTDGGAARKREIWFDGMDEPLGPTEEEETEQAPAESAGPEPEDPPPPPDEAELARRLGISFRDGEVGSADLERQRSRSEAKMAQKLGIRFRDDEGEHISEAESDEQSEAARRLGISFRDPEDDRPVKKKVSLVGRLILLFTLFSGFAGLALLLIFGESLFEALFG